MITLTIYNDAEPFKEVDVSLKHIEMIRKIKTEAGEEKTQLFLSSGLHLLVNESYVSIKNLLEE